MNQCSGGSGALFEHCVGLCNPKSFMWRPNPAGSLAMTSSQLVVVPTDRCMCVIQLNSHDLLTLINTQSV